jgi:hypothetical protein
LTIMETPFQFQIALEKGMRTLMAHNLNVA